MFGIVDTFWNHPFIVSVQVDVCFVDTFAVTNAAFRDQGLDMAPKAHQVQGVELLLKEEGAAAN